MGKMVYSVTLYRAHIHILNCLEDSLSYVLYAEVIAVSGCNNFCAMLMGL